MEKITWERMADEDTIRMTGIWKEDEWLTFEIYKKKPKTNVWTILSKSSDCELGKVKWHPSWRHYCFFPTIEEECVYSDRCLLSISEFLTDINKLHKNGKINKNKEDN